MLLGINTNKIEISNIIADACEKCSYNVKKKTVLILRNTSVTIDLPCVKVGRIDEKSSLKPKLLLEFPVDSSGTSFEVEDSDGKVIPAGDS